MRPIEFLISGGMGPKAAGLLQALQRGAEAQRLETRMLYSYEARKRAASLLVLYGMGRPDRQQAAHAHMRAGGRVLAWDAGYWDRELPVQDRKYRCSLDAMHPQKWVMAGPAPGPARLGGIVMEKVADPRGPVVLVGNGPKSIVAGAGGWAQQWAQAVRRAFPRARLVYRPKPKRPHEHGVIADEVSVGPPIDALLRGAALVVCRHSNVAIDACRLGIPVVCEDGAAAAIYPRRLEDFEAQPGRAKREEFLRRLAWWQWSTREAGRGEPWRWLRGIPDAL